MWSSTSWWVWIVVIVIDRFLVVDVVGVLPKCEREITVQIILIQPRATGVTGTVISVHIAILLHCTFGCMQDLLLAAYFN